MSDAEAIITATRRCFSRGMRKARCGLRAVGTVSLALSPAPASTGASHRVSLLLIGLTPTYVFGVRSTRRRFFVHRRTKVNNIYIVWLRVSTGLSESST